MQIAKPDIARGWLRREASAATILNKSIKATKIKAIEVLFTTS